MFFGPVGRLSCLEGKLRDLEADIDDVYQILLGFDRNLIGHLMVDVIARHISHRVPSMATRRSARRLKRLAKVSLSNARALNDGIDLFLEGPAVKPVFRSYN